MPKAKKSRGGNAHQRKIRHGDSKVEIRQDNLQLGSPILMRERAFRLFENPIILSVLSIFFGIIGTFVNGYYYLLLLPVVAAGVHRSRVLNDLTRGVRIISYVVLLGMTAFLQVWAARRLNAARVSPDEVARKVKGMLPQTAPWTINNVYPSTVVKEDSPPSPDTLGYIMGGNSWASLEPAHIANPIGTISMWIRVHGKYALHSPHIVVTDITGTHAVMQTDMTDVPGDSTYMAPLSASINPLHPHNEYFITIGSNNGATQENLTIDVDEKGQWKAHGKVSKQINGVLKTLETF